MIAQCGNDAIADPKLYVQTILDVHKIYHALAQDSFKNDAGFVKALDQACRKFINSNEITKITKSPSKSPELLAKYCDSLLKKSTNNRDENELNEIFNQIIIVFKYIDDKDVFQTYYKRMLAKRLINQSSISDDAELTMIAKLKETCGAEYTNKLQRMFQDILISRDLNDKYRQQQKEKSVARN